MKFLIDDLGRDKVTFATNGFAERVRGVGNVLTEEGGEVPAIVGEFDLMSGLRAVRAGLPSVRGANRDVKGSVGVAQGGGEDIRGSQVKCQG